MALGILSASNWMGRLMPMLFLSDWADGTHRPRGTDGGHPERVEGACYAWVREQLA